MKKAGIIIGIIAAIALVICLVPLKEVAYTAMVDYEDMETYYEDEPYEVTEIYTETVPLDYEVVESEQYIEGATSVFSVVVRNEDNIAGAFTVDFSIMYGCTFIAPGYIQVASIPFSHEEELHLGPNDTRTGTYSADNPYPANCGLDSWDYDITPATKELERERTVIKYHQVEKQRTVIKQRPETRYKRVTLLDYLLHY